MEKKKELDAFVVPDELLSKVRGGMNVDSQGSTSCPNCSTGAPIHGTLNIPPIYKCTGCGCSWRIVLHEGVYYVQILNPGRKM